VVKCKYLRGINPLDNDAFQRFTYRAIRRRVQRESEPNISIEQAITHLIIDAQQIREYNGSDMECIAGISRNCVPCPEADFIVVGFRD
jgi:hypothetical protein